MFLYNLKHQKNISNGHFARIAIHGHDHSFDFHIDHAEKNRFVKKIIIGAPSLSNLCSYGVIAPTMLRLHLTFDKMYISSIYVEELVLENECFINKTMRTLQ